MMCHLDETYGSNNCTFLVGNQGGQKKRGSVYQVLSEKNDLGVLYPAQTIFRSEGEKKIFR